MSLSRTPQSSVTSSVRDSLRPLEEENEELRRVVEALHRELERTREGSRRKSEFLVNLNNELRTPLTAIQGYTEMMYDSRQNVTERLGCIGRIRQNVKQLTDLLDDIIDLSRVETGQIELQRGEIQFLSEMGEILADMRGAAWKKRLSFDARFEGSMPVTIDTDPVRFRQLVCHILDRAVKDTDRGGIYVNVKAAKENNETMVIITVTDTGHGISPHQQPDIFDPFAHEESHLTTPHGGVVIGLSLARRIARAMGGDVELVASEIDRGSTFSITLKGGPANLRRWVDQVSDADLAPRPADQPMTLSRKKLDGMKVLLVEDAADIQVLVAHFLKRNGVTVDIADNGVEGMRKARAAHYDLILMDLQMPLLNGYDTINMLQKEGLTTPVVALTAHTLKGTKEKCLSLGCKDYLAKPINAHALLDLCSRFHSSATRLHH